MNDDICFTVLIGHVKRTAGLHSFFHREFGILRDEIPLGAEEYQNQYKNIQSGDGVEKGFYGHGISLRMENDCLTPGKMAVKKTNAG